MKHIIVIGGGAAGSMAAIAAAKQRAKVTLFEKNEKIGKKLYITGKGRCNVTNACADEDFFKSVISNPKFMYSSLYGFDAYAVMDFFESAGLKLKTERGERVFPESDKSSDVIRTLEKTMRSLGVDIRFNCEIKDIVAEDGAFSHVILSNGEEIYGDSCIVATGGLSYPSTGSTGDGYRFAKCMGHKVTRLVPSLVSVKVREEWVKELEGLSLRNVVLSAYMNGKLRYSDMGEMLFTHNGISGPLVLTLSSLLADDLISGNRIDLFIDLKPALDEDKLDVRVLKDFEEFSNRQFANSLSKLLPDKIIPVVVRLCGIDPYKRVNVITKEERASLIRILKAFPLTALRSGGYDEAVITKGGVSVREVSPSSMESKLVRGLFFAGEVLDLDALTGGFNLQIAWSTGYAAGVAASEESD